MIDCKTIAAGCKARLKEKIALTGREVGLAVIQVGDDPASNSYINGKKADCDEIGIKFNHLHYNTNVTTQELIFVIKLLNEDPLVHGIIVQLPLPDHIDKGRVLNTISDEKDVDGFKHSSVFTPCTPLGVMMILDHLKYNVDRKICCVVGRGEVGKPMVDLLTNHNATVIWCNSHTSRDSLACMTMCSDVIISATGVPSLIDETLGEVGDCGQIVIDVGISRGTDGKLCGDVSKNLYMDNKNITPVPGGVGLMTRVALLENTVKAAFEFD